MQEMSSDSIPITQCVHIFKGELEQLKSRLGEAIGQNGLCCYLYGLWTHSSNVVVHLVVSDQKEYDYARKHQLDCVGYVAKEYTKHLHDIVKELTGLSARRQHIIVDVSDTKNSKRSNALRAYGSHPDMFQRENPIRPELLQVKILQYGSPFRKELRVIYPGRETAMNGYQIERENDFGSHSHVAGNGAVTESETGSYRENKMNGHQDAKIDQNSSLVRSIKNKIKAEFQLAGDDDILVEERLDKYLLVLHFEHNGKHWQIELRRNEHSEYFVEILFSELGEALLSPSTTGSQEMGGSKFVVDKIKQLCQCEKCKK